MDHTTLIERLRRSLPSVPLEGSDARDQPVLVVPREHLVEVCRALRDDPDLDFAFLAELTAVDWWPKAPRFEVVYLLACLGTPGAAAAKRLRVKVRVPGDDAVIPTVTEVWPNANWYEREIWDLFGIFVTGHPDLRRILMPEDWEGHPLRKDYPVQVRVPATAAMPLSLTEEEFLANFARQRAVRDRPSAAGPGGAARPADEPR